MISTSTHQQISKFAIAWQIESAFWGRLFASIPKRDSEHVESIALQPAEEGYVQLAVNPVWAAAQEEHALRLWLQHELMHLLLGHPFRAGDFANPTLFHIAADMEANRFFPTGQLPPDAILPSQFPEIGFPQEGSLQALYQRLQTGLRQYWEGTLDNPSLQRLADLASNGNAALRRHRHWAPAGAMQETLTAWWQAWREETLRNPGKEQAGIAEAISPSSARPSAGWKRALHLFAAASGRTRLKHTIHRVSKRYGAVPGLRIRQRCRLWVAVDTSGSVSAEDLGRFFREIDHIRRSGAELTVLECDYALRRRYRYTGSAPTQVHGRGGTRFDPVLEAAAEERPDGLIYFTDGLAAVPKTACPVPVLWMISPGGIGPEDGRWGMLPGKVWKVIDD